ncbi:hypothetical protein V6N11_031757 [Hibiscus sabdariffa]|uniref:Uncharacterized protein n=1 Tax=Hibiscus sabdariffa TaxID=183260 RepID=A0ABR2SYT6_9ROSI
MSIGNTSGGGGCKEEETASKITIGRLVGFQFDLRTFLSSGKKDNNYDSRCLMERAAVLEKEVNLEGADKQLEENEEVKESHCEVEKAGCVQFFEVGGRSSIDVGKGIAKKTWAEVLVDQCPTQSLAQNESSPDLGPHSINTLSKANAGLEVGGGYLEPGLLGHHLNKELTQLEVVQSPDPIEGTGREVVLSSLDNFGELETFSPKVRSSKKYGSLWEIQDRALSKVEKRRRSHGTSRCKNKAEENQDSILSGRSLSDSDIRLKWERARKDARSTLAFGK